MIVPQHHAQLLDVNSHLALEILGQHLAFEVELLQPIFQVHDTLESRGVCVRENTALYPNRIQPQSETAQTPYIHCLFRGCV